MRFCHVLFLVLAQFSFPNAFAQNLNSKTWSVRSDMDGKIIIETFQKAADGWQDLVERRQFITAEAAQAYLNKTKNHVVEQSLASGRELRNPILTSANNNVLWTATAKWNLDWEDKFSKWIASDVDAQFFKQHNLATDCADVLYSLRWIFARMNHLEMASRLSGSGDYLTHRSLRGSWAGLPTAVNWYDDKRFLAALDYLLDNTYTHSLMSDAYPVAITPEAIRAGTFHLDLHSDSGHTQVVSRSMLDSPTPLPFIIIQSTTPRAVRVLSTAGFWYVKQPILSEGGLLRMRWPDFKNGTPSLVPAKQMPYFSEEQYGPDFLRTPGTPFNQEVYLRLNPNLNLKDVLKQAKQSIRDAFTDRLRIVEDGFQACRKNACPPSSQLYDDWSTPSRDRRISDLIDQHDALESLLGASREIDVPFLSLDGELYNLAALRRTWQFKIYSSDPNDSPEKRWGLDASSNLDFLRSQAEELIKERERIQSQGKPLTENTVKLLNWRSLLGNYCISAPNEQCSRFLGEMKNLRLSSLQHGFTLEELLRRIPWMSSENGKGPVWGETFSQSNAIDTLTLRSLQTNTNGWLLADGANGNWHLQFVESGKIQTIANIFSKNRLHLVANAIWSWQDHRLQIWPLQNKQVASPLEVPLAWEPKMIQVIGNYLIPIHKDGPFSVGRWIADPSSGLHEWQWLHHGQDLLLDGESPYLAESIVGANGQETRRVLDLSNPDLTRVDAGESIPNFPLPSEDTGEILAGNSAYIIFKNGLLEKRSGQWIPNSFEGCQFSKDSRYALCVNPPQKTTELLDLQDPLQPKVLKHLSAIGYLSDNFLQAMNINQPGWSYYRWNQDHLESLPVGTDEIGITYACSEYFVAKTKNGESRIYRSGAHTPWMEIQGRVWGSRVAFENVGLFQAADNDGLAISTYSLASKQLLMRNPRPADMIYLDGPRVSGNLGYTGYLGLWWPPQQ